MTPVSARRFGDCRVFSLAGAAETAYLLASDPTLPGVELTGKDGMDVDNYPIKAILTPTGK